jgi:Fur family iron response transcriptional regulator
MQARFKPDYRRFLLRAGLRPTQQRSALAELLFKGDRHVTAEQLHKEAVAAGSDVSLATVYNTLHSFRQAGLVREVAIEGSQAYFDTNTSNHNHFYFEDTREVVDIPQRKIELQQLPTPPDGYEIALIDVVIRLVPTRKSQ